MFKIFNNKKILITGNTGFKGSWLSLWLKELGASVFGLSDKIVTSPSFFESGISSLIEEQFFLDINDDEVKAVIFDIKPDYIFHLAAQALVIPSYEDPHKTIMTNASGTSNLLNILRNYNDELKLILITSDKVYENNEWTWGYRENDLIGGLDPYSASKSMAEIAIRSYVNSFYKNESSVRIAIARAGNVIGGGDWSKNRIIPDAVRAWRNGERLIIRKPDSTRPWQHVLEPISGYLTLAEKLNQDTYLHGEAFNFGPDLSSPCTVGSLIERIAKYWDNFEYEISNTTDKSHHEAGLLALNCDKAKNLLNWFPILDLNQTIDFTAEWYGNFYSDEGDIISLSLEQIKKFSEQR